MINCIVGKVSNAKVMNKPQLYTFTTLKHFLRI